MDDTEYQFTTDWASQHRSVWLQLFEMKPPTRMVEIGSYEGRTTCFMIEQCAEQRPIEIWSVDTWQGGIEHDPASMSDVEKRFDHNVAAARAKAKHPATVTKLKKASNLALAGLLAEQGGPTMDLIYVDGSHQAPDVLFDAVVGFELLKVGGVMIFDDYLWSMGDPLRKDPLEMAKPAIDAFMNIYMRKMHIFAEAPLYQLYAEKIAA